MQGRIITQELVNESCDNAVANGYDLRSWSIEDIVIDMTTCEDLQECMIVFDCVTVEP